MALESPQSKQSSELLPRQQRVTWLHNRTQTPFDVHTCAVRMSCVVGHMFWSNMLGLGSCQHRRFLCCWLWARLLLLRWHKLRADTPTSTVLTCWVAVSNYVTTGCATSLSVFVGLFVELHALVLPAV